MFNANFLAGLTSDDLGTYLKMKDVERSVPRVKREHEAIDNENADAMAVADFDGLEGLAAQWRGAIRPMPCWRGASCATATAR